MPSTPTETNPSGDPTPGSENLPAADAELRWLKTVYRPDERQLTVRAVIVGMIIGAVMCVMNLYVVLKAGWSIGVTVTACILAFSLFKVLERARLTKAPFTELENNAMGSVASAAGYMTGGGNMAAVPALLLLTGFRPDTGWLMAWFATIAALGVFAAIPLKRAMINVEQLPFPSGTATAETIRTLNAHGEEGVQRAKKLSIASVVSALVVWLKDAKIPFALPSKLGPAAWAPFSVSFDVSTMFIGVGAIIGLRTAWSMLLGAVVTYGILAPWIVSSGIIPKAEYKLIVTWSLWTGAAILVSSGLLSFALQWKMVSRAFTALFEVFRPRRATDALDPMAAVEAPAYWFPAGFVVLGPAVVFLGWFLFGIPWWAGVLALPLAVLMGAIAARATGETDFTPTKALGPLTQMTFGVIVPKDITVNIMSANITGGVGLHAADLLTDLKSGYLLGAKPRQQIYAQLFGVLAGALVVVPVYNLLIPDAKLLGTAEWPAPAVLVWASVSQLLQTGLHALHPTARWAALIGALIGCTLVILEKSVPKRFVKFVPNASGVGTAFFIPFYNSLSIFIGGVLAWWLTRRDKKLADSLVLPVAAGLIAGESLLGVVIALLKVFHVL